jgi:hypothetical protein
LAGHATRFMTLPGGRLKRWNNKQHTGSWLKDRYDGIRHSDLIRARIIDHETPPAGDEVFFYLYDPSEYDWEDFEDEEEEITPPSWALDLEPDLDPYGYEDDDFYFDALSRSRPLRMTA